MINNVIKEKLKLLKPLPGSYQMKNKEGKVIYVGKAKKLVNRVSSYFLQTHTGKTAKLVSEIEDFDYIYTSSEKEALLLEINLIHQYNPAYNILLKDNRAYPYIQLHMCEHPYLTIARSMKEKNSKYFGPYSDSSSAYEMLNLLNRLFPLRKCRHVPATPCLYYHINQCLGPCCNKVSKKDYDNHVNNIISFLNGNTSNIKNKLKAQMLEASENLNFELANEYKIQIQSIEHISSKQYIQLPNKISADVFNYHCKDDYISVSVLVYRDGVLKFKHNQVLEYFSNSEDAFIDFIIQYYEQNTIPKEIIVPKNEELKILEILGTNLIYPTKGTKFNLLSMAGLNAVEQMNEKYMISKMKDDENQQIQDDLESIIGIKGLETIELIDNSHFNGSDPVSAVVVFKNLKPNKKQYRKYRLDTSNAKDDLLSMNETLYRRYYRKIVDGEALSDLLIVDGGLNQINSAKESIGKLGIEIPIIGLSKDDKHTTDSIVLESGEKIYIKDKKGLYFLLCKMQDEVHNFVIGFHKDSRSKRMTRSLLDDIKGLGDKRKQKLIDIFNDIETIKKLSVEELSNYIPRDVAIEVYKKLNN